MLTDESRIEEYVDTEPMTAAEFLIDEIAKHQRAIETAKSVADSILEARRKEIMTWRDEKLIAPEQAAIDRLEPLLRSIVERKTKGTGKKSLSLPSGRAGFRSVEPSFFFHGEKADATNGLFVAELALKGKSPYIKQKPVLDWTGFKQSLRIADDGSVCTSDGELIDGLTAQINPDKFYVKKFAQPVRDVV